MRLLNAVFLACLLSANQAFSQLAKTPGTPHELYPHVVYGENGEKRPAEGYEWLTKVEGDYRVVPKRTTTSPQSTGWELTPGLINDIFPSMILATANANRDALLKISAPQLAKTCMNRTLGEPSGLITSRVQISLTAELDNEQVSGQVKSSKLIAPSSFQFTLPHTGVEYYLFPKVQYDYKALQESRQPYPEDITVVLTRGGGKTSQQTVTAQVRAISDCPLFVVNPKGQRIMTMYWMFAAYANRSNPLVQAVLKQGMQSGVVQQYAGYQGSEQDVWMQAWSVWNAFLRMGFKYSSITEPSAFSSRVFSQRVRLFEDSMGSSQANCVDGSVLFASVFQAIGLRPMLVLIPGHCFVGVFLDEKASTPIFIETTMMGITDLKHIAPSKKFMAMMVEHRLSDGRKLSASGIESYNAFVAAVQEGGAKFERARADIAAQKDGYSVIDLKKCEELNIGQIYRR